MQPVNRTVSTSSLASSTTPVVSDTVVRACLQHPDYHLHGLNFRRTEEDTLALEQLRFMRVNRATFDLSAFLDNRIYAPRKTLVDIPTDRLLAQWRRRQTATAHFIFHTAFCCSTLLSRLLQAPGYTVALREPWALRAVAEMQRSGHVPQRFSQHDWQQLVALVVDLLAKTYHEHEQVVIKPSNLCNGLVDDLLIARPQAKAVWLTNGLREFLVSVLKKNPETQTKMKGLAALVYAAPQVHTAVGTIVLNQLNVLQAAAMLWQGQQEQLSSGVARWGGRIRSLTAADLIARPAEVCNEVSDFLGLGLAPDYFSGNAFQAALHHHAKAPQLSYDAELRSDENRRVERQHQRQLDAAINWHARYFNTAEQASVA